MFYAHITLKRILVSKLVQRTVRHFLLTVTSCVQLVDASSLYFEGWSLGHSIWCLKHWFFIYLLAFCLVSTLVQRTFSMIMSHNISSGTINHIPKFIVHIIDLSQSYVGFSIQVPLITQLVTFIFDPNCPHWKFHNISPLLVATSFIKLKWCLI
jgi:hypothetical protein